MDDQELKRKFRGALLGVAVGDALGAPFEGMPSVSQILVLEWAADHRAELMEDWKLCSQMQTPKPIEPLK